MKATVTDEIRMPTRRNMNPAVEAEAKKQSTATQTISNRRVRVMALRAKLTPISLQDANRINEAIMEAREASIPGDLSA